jgi:hypothetical protein
MAIETTVIYEQACKSFRHASDTRTRMVIAWLAIYGAFATALVLLLPSGEQLPCYILLGAALLTTLMFWYADYRVRPAVERAKYIGQHIETDPESEIPDERRFFTHLERGIPYRVLIDLFAVVSVVLLVAGAAVLG